MRVYVLCSFEPKQNVPDDDNQHPRPWTNAPSDAVLLYIYLYTL